jgi:hypothetical protein
MAAGVGLVRAALLGRAVKKPSKNRHSMYLELWEKSGQ